MTQSLRQAGDDLDLEIEASQPVDAHGGPVRIGLIRKDLRANGIDRLELNFRVGVNCLLYTSDAADE